MCNLGVLSDLNVKKIAYLVSGDCLYTTSWELFKTLLKPDQAYIFYAHRMQTCGGDGHNWSEKYPIFSDFLNFKFVQTETLLPSEWAKLSLKKILLNKIKNKFY